MEHDCGPVCSHASDCAIHSEPAYPAGPCNCEPGAWRAFARWDGIDTSDPPDGVSDTFAQGYEAGKAHALGLVYSPGTCDRCGGSRTILSANFDGDPVVPCPDCAD